MVDSYAIVIFDCVSRYFLHFIWLPVCCVLDLGYSFLTVICLNCHVLLWIIPTCRPYPCIATLESECCSVDHGICLGIDCIYLPIGCSIPGGFALFSMIILGWALIVYSNSALLSIYLFLGYNQVGYLLCEYPIRTLLFCFVRGSGLMVMHDVMLFRYLRIIVCYFLMFLWLSFENNSLGFTLLAWYFGSILPTPLPFLLWISAWLIPVRTRFKKLHVVGLVVSITLVFQYGQVFYCMLHEFACIPTSLVLVNVSHSGWSNCCIPLSPSVQCCTCLLCLIIFHFQCISSVRWLYYVVLLIPIGDLGLCWPCLGFCDFLTTVSRLGLHEWLAYECMMVFDG